jgi:hypothetical protein
MLTIIIHFKNVTMKTTRFTLSALIALISIITACQRDVKTLTTPPKPVDEQVNSGRKSETGICDPSGYILTLESRTLVGSNWEWVWSIENTNPGNGSPGTWQDLSHWGMSFGSCFDYNTVVGASFSSNGLTWVSFNPSYQVDPSQGCYTTPVLKFNYGTSGTNKSYYKLILSDNYSVISRPGYYKSGGNTGCCTFNFVGVGCVEPVEVEDPVE